MTRLYRPGQAGPRDSSPDPRHRPGGDYQPPAQHRKWYRRWLERAARHEREGMSPVTAKHEATKRLREEGYPPPWEQNQSPPLAGEADEGGAESTTGEAAGHDSACGP